MKTSYDLITDTNKLKDDDLDIKSRDSCIKKSSFDLDKNSQELLENASSFVTNKYESKVGFLKEGYTYFKEINPIDRYNFVIERYNEEFNRIGNKILRKVPTNKAIKTLYNIYTWLSRMILSSSIIVVYYFLLCVWKSKYETRKEFNFTKKDDIVQMKRGKFKSKLFAYKNYLLSDNKEFYSHYNENNISVWIILQSIIFFSISLYIILLFFILMLIPNIIFTVYLLYAYYIHRNNSQKVKNIFSNMILDDSLDVKCQLNDYIIIEPGAINLYYGSSFHDQLETLYNNRDKFKPQVFMVYGHLLKEEYGIIDRALFRQIISVVGFIILTIYYYYI